MHSHCSHPLWSPLSLPDPSSVLFPHLRFFCFFVFSIDLIKTNCVAAGWKLSLRVWRLTVWNTIQDYPPPEFTSLSIVQQCSVRPHRPLPNCLWLLTGCLVEAQCRQLQLFWDYVCNGYVMLSRYRCSFFLPCLALTSFCSLFCNVPKGIEWVVYMSCLGLSIQYFLYISFFNGYASLPPLLFTEKRIFSD